MMEDHTINFISGNIFDNPSDIMVNAVNCIGIMGGGIALQFRKRHPAMFAAYVEACRRKEIRVGQIWVYEDPAYTIVNFPTKNDLAPSEYHYIRSGLASLADYLYKNPGKSISIPSLGCGLGGLDWAIVSDMIRTMLSDCPNTINVFEPQQVGI